MSKPIREYSLGKCKAAVFQGEYDGKPTYSVKFQKSYKKDDEWKNTDYFNLTDLRDLAALVNGMLTKQIKERIPGETSAVEKVKDTFQGKEIEHDPSNSNDVPF